MDFRHSNRNDGGHPELASYGGVPFEDEHDVLKQLDRIANHYELFAQLVRPPTLDDAVDGYLRLLMDVGQSQSCAA